jgi:hypothetical protein
MDWGMARANRLSGVGGDDGIFGETITTPRWWKTVRICGGA